MEIESYLIKIVFLAFLLLLSALVAGSQIALYTLSDKEVKQLRKEDAKRSRRLIWLHQNQKLLGQAAAVGIWLVSVMVVYLCLITAEWIVQVSGLKLEIVFLWTAVSGFGFFYLFKGLALRPLAAKYHKVFLYLGNLPLFIFFEGVAPLIRIRNKWIEPQKEQAARNRPTVNRQNIIDLIENVEDRIPIEETERTMIHSIFELAETEVHEIMVPRTDMVCVEENTGLSELTKLIEEKGHTRFPLYRESVDNILGIIHAKDLLPYLIQKNNEPFHLRELARPAYYVPESKKLHLLLNDFQRGKHHMAIIIDEYGGTAGLVTLEDVIEEIIGDIQDEYDREQPLYRKIDENTYVINAKIDLHELNESLDIELPTEGGFESLGGFILSLTGYVPSEKEVVEYDGFTFTVEKIDRNRIIRVKLFKHPHQLTENGSSDSDEQK